MSFKIKQITGKIKVVTGLHIGSGNTEMHIGGTDNPVIKNAVTNEPYIPGSSLKGKMRSLFRLYEGNGDNGENVVKLFGSPAGSDTVKPACLSFWDCFLTQNWKDKISAKQIPLTEIKMENTIHPLTAQANPRSMERVLPDSEFDFKLTVKQYDGEDVLKTVLGTMKLLEMDALGGSGSRGYGRVKFEELKIDGKDIKDFDSIKPFENRFI